MTLPTPAAASLPAVPDGADRSNGAGQLECSPPSGLSEQLPERAVRVCRCRVRMPRYFQSVVRFLAGTRTCSEMGVVVEALRRSGVLSDIYYAGKGTDGRGPIVPMSLEDYTRWDEERVRAILCGDVR